MKPGSTMRVVRPTDNLAAIARMYVKGLGLDVLAEFEDHHGFDGVILGHPKQPYHIEFASQRGHEVGKAPTRGSSRSIVLNASWITLLSGWCEPLSICLSSATSSWPRDTVTSIRHR